MSGANSDSLLLLATFQGSVSYMMKHTNELFPPVFLYFLW